MCGRYALSSKPDVIAERFGLAAIPRDIEPNFNAAPSQNLPVITEAEDGTWRVELMQWGIPRVFGSDLVKELINTRSDKAFGGFWRKTVCSHRCLVPANGFYEWRATRDGKVPYCIHLAGEDLFAFVGIWDVWRDQDGQERKRYSIMTTDSNKEMRAIHTRVPVVLRRADETVWLKQSNDTPEVLGAVLLPPRDGSFEMYEVGRDVNDPRNNSATLLRPVG